MAPLAVASLTLVPRIPASRVARTSPPAAPAAAPRSRDYLVTDALAMSIPPILLTAEAPVAVSQTAPRLQGYSAATVDMSAEPILRTQGLVKTYGKRTVVNQVDINVRRGEIVGLLGPNGAGKTTSFYMIVGFVPPTAGHIITLTVTT